MDSCAAANPLAAAFWGKSAGTFAGLPCAFLLFLGICKTSKNKEHSFVSL